MSKANSNRKFLSLNREALLMAAAAAQSADTRVLGQLGVQPETVPLLKTMKASDLEKLENFPASLVEVRFNPHSIEMLLMRMNEERQSVELMDRAIRGGIRFPSLNRLSGISRLEFDQRCEMLGVALKTPGRVDAFNERKEIQVDGCWKTATDALGDQHDTLLERLVYTHDKTGASIDQIWNLVIEQI